MQISPLTIYAIQALQELKKNGPLQGEEIARRLDISSAYAKKTLHALRQAGLVRNSRQTCGYMVVGRPLLLQVLEATEGILPDQAGETKDMMAIRRRLRERIAGGLKVSVST